MDMFRTNKAITTAEYGPIGDWDVSAVTDVIGLFTFLPAFNDDISKWNTASVSSMRSMFYGSYSVAGKFNQNLASWNTARVTNVGSDACPNQSDLAAQYRWISMQQNKTGIQMDWTLNCLCHAKGPSDGIGADVKGSINAEQMLDADDRPTRVEDCKRVLDVLQRKLLYAKAYLGQE